MKAECKINRLPAAMDAEEDTLTEIVENPISSVREIGENIGVSKSHVQKVPSKYGYKARIV